MKINKLFHWLYAILMLLPIFAIGFTCAYTIFNKNAYESYSGSNYGSREYVLVNNITELERDKTYYLDTYSVNMVSSSNIGAWSYLMNVHDVSIINTTQVLNQSSSNIKSISFYYNTSYGTRIQYQFTYLDNSTQVFNQAQSVKLTFIYESNNFNYNWASLDIFYNVIYNNFAYLDNVFYYSLDEMKNNPLFSWANNNFLTNPFSYLFNLFGVPTNCGIMTLLSYWLDISIIWLVFDLIMYVPLLAHRWIDKGMVD